MTQAPAGLVARRVRLAQRDVVLLGGLLHGEDHFASIHGEPGEPEGERVINGAKRNDGRPTPAPFAGVGMPSRSGATRVIVSVVTTCSRARELDAWLTELQETLDLELLDGE